MIRRPEGTFSGGGNVNVIFTKVTTQEAEGCGCKGGGPIMTVLLGKIGLSIKEAEMKEYPKMGEGFHRTRE